MKIVIAGGTGLLGNALVNHYLNSDHRIVILSRSHRRNFKNIEYCKWDAKNQGYWSYELENADVLINLNGKSVDCRYSERNKQMIYDSRLDSTFALGRAVQQCTNPPKLWINAASATIYPHSLAEEMTESHHDFAEDFSVDVCKKWESVFQSFELPNTRKVLFRIGIVLSKKGSALFPLKLMTKSGFGFKIGRGNQMISWLHENDFVNAVNFMISHEDQKGVYNITSPHPVANKHFFKTLRNVMRIPYGISLPAWLLEFGAMIINTESELVLKSRYVIPERLLNEGFSFEFPELKSALENLLRE